MPATGEAHDAAFTQTNELLMSLRSQAKMMVRGQSPLLLNDYSELQPDFALLKVNPMYYLYNQPTAVDVYLVIEIADSSFAYDCEIKGKLYAQSGIVDYWVLDVNRRQLQVFREPSAEGYQSQVIVTEDASISPQQFPAIAIAVQAMLPVTNNQ
jgi:Uma2 family endonuclease